MVGAMSRARLFLALGVAAVAAAIVIGEQKRPLRKRVRKTIPRTARNVAMGASCAVVIAAVEEPLTKRIARSNLEKGQGFARHLPRPLRILGGVAAMDYGFYLWHVATHKVPFLWRFHRIHHLDPDMDASTAMRFHAADMLISLPWRLVQVRLSGVSPKSLALWRHFFNFSILFHHANLRLPGKWDERLSAVLTTPKMHGIHHSNVQSERDSNWTSGLSFWDRLHGTFRQDVRQEDLVIGVADVAAEEDEALEKSLTAPFKPFPSSKRTM
jgi:sterol desaturase/sphingolipid hydroxylase (fatty acid hydroxylase superfamily)